jgi:hypothetical protein
VLERGKRDGPERVLSLADPGGSSRWIIQVVHHATQSDDPGGSGEPFGLPMTRTGGEVERSTAESVTVMTGKRGNSVGQRASFSHHHR